MFLRPSLPPKIFQAVQTGTIKFKQQCNCVICHYYSKMITIYDNTWSVSTMTISTRTKKLTPLMYSNYWVEDLNIRKGNHDMKSNISVLG